MNIHFLHFGVKSEKERGKLTTFQLVIVDNLDQLLFQVNKYILHASKFVAIISRARSQQNPFIIKHF